MQTETEKKVHDLKTAIARESNPLRKSNLRWRLSAIVKQLADKEFQEKRRRLSGNAY